ncbi:MAG TPA: hypothetical protein VMU54_12255 [Planctomycetota bacterium]|nr:hypothetical protein [Planctomycetota bacterium]
MRKLLSLTLLALLMLPAPAASADPARSRFSSLFCPECWTYLYGHGATDLKGNCAACGKYPLELEVQTMSWFWSPQKHLWLQDPMKGTLPAESLAAVTRPGPGLSRAHYCPEHRNFKGVRLPLLQRMVCAEDGKPMVLAWASHRTWFWCEWDGGWSLTRSPEDPIKHCCTPRTGLLLATPQRGPMAGD